MGGEIIKPFKWNNNFEGSMIQNNNIMDNDNANIDWIWEK